MKNKPYFLKDIETLAKNWQLLELWLNNHEFGNVHQYAEAYTYFMTDPKNYDGATVIRDIQILNGLDPFAMLHDYKYIKAKNIKDRLKADWRYAKDMEKAKIHPFTAYSRGIGLIFINITGIYKLFKFLTR
jgi:hypothetical protein